MSSMLDLMPAPALIFATHAHTRLFCVFRTLVPLRNKEHGRAVIVLSGLDEEVVHAEALSIRYPGARGGDANSEDDQIQR